MRMRVCFVAVTLWIRSGMSRDEDKIMKACYWPNEVYEPCFGGCAEVSCDNPRNHLRPCYPYCEPGCVCGEPYVRDDRSHQCVLPQDCSPTQMGIPVANRKHEVIPPSKHSSRADVRRNEVSGRRSGFSDPSNLYENELPANVRIDDQKKAEASRMGNYFNIVIAPPPIKTIQPRKTMQNEAEHPHSKRYEA